jgi:DNA polymerase
VPSQGKKFVVADFSSIERLVLAWMAGERWVVEAYARGEDLYLATASRMFGREITDKKAPERAVAKVLDLACGYSGGTGAADKFCEALRVDIPQTRQSELVRTWRDANPHVGLCHKMLDT